MKPAKSLVEKNKFLLDRDIDSFRFNHASIFNTLNKQYSNSFDLNSDIHNLSIYIGFPWCNKKCIFCNYTCGIESQKSKHILYSQLLEKEISLYKEKLENKVVSSIYFGGGTPTIQNNEILYNYLKTNIGLFKTDASTLINIESDISNLDNEKMRVCSTFSNRISIGVQTFNDYLRFLLNRKSTKKDVIKSIETVYDYFDNVNVDLIYGFFYQSEELFIEDINFCIQLEIPSITLYKLEFFKNTSVYKKYLLSPHIFPNNVETMRMYISAKNILLSNGYIENPVGWFIKKKIQNPSQKWDTRVKKWKADNTYLGFGVKAFSDYSEFHYINYSDFNKYYKKIDSNINPIEFIRQKHPVERKILSEIKNAKVNQNINKDILKICKSFSSDLYNKLLGYFRHLIKLGYILETNNSYSLTFEGIAIIHFILGDITRITVNSILNNNESI